jgi:hypothetical protein
MDDADGNNIVAIADAMAARVGIVDEVQGWLVPRRLVRNHDDVIAWAGNRREADDDRLEQMRKTDPGFEEAKAMALRLHRFLPPRDVVLSVGATLDDAVEDVASRKQQMTLVAFMVRGYPNFREDRAGGYVQACQLALLELPGGPPSPHVLAAAVVECLQEIAFLPSPAELVRKVLDRRAHFRMAADRFQRLQYTRGCLDTFLEENDLVEFDRQKINLDDDEAPF